MVSRKKNNNSKRKKWEKETLKPFLKKSSERLSEFTTLSSEPIERLYTPEHLKKFSYRTDLGFPGEFPLTRGVYPSMHRGRLWTMRQFAGFGTAHDTNQRFHYLLKEGQTGLSTAFHFPTLMGYDSDSPRSRGEVGVCGVAIDSLADMETLFNGIPLDKVTVSMTINGPASILLAFFLVCAEKQNVPWTKVGGTIQNDVLKEYIAQNSYLVPPEPAMKIVVDMIEFCSKQVPKWNPVSISGYHIREAGSTAVQELAFTLADGVAYVQACIERGMKVDDFAPRLSFFFNAHMDLFEEVAKYRAARRLWARLMKTRFKAKKPESWKCRFHVQTAGCSLTAQQPENNIIRTTLQALGAVLGGCQSLHTNSMDETFALPTEKSVRIALRTQQVIAYESGVTNTIDPLGGSYFVEALTSKMEKEALDYIRKIDRMGGMIPAIRNGYPQMEIANASHRYQNQVERSVKIIVGVNDFVLENEPPIEILKIDSAAIEERQRQSLKELKSVRNVELVQKSLDALRQAALNDQNIMPALLDSARAYATVGEMADVLRKVYGEYHDPGIY
ncbi:MAG TPA: methylmalonyl-CoA mutase [Deltaproteobacteria bacterium]|nr:MAG: methylmalonyl-CoA mutase [Deltaproteobacteria bacterium GWA2_45_12]HBF12131.1 methylmalonyl-CoA mutase [Deltaproteobacteria bacterium]